MRNGLKYMFLVCLCMLVAGTASLAPTNWDYVLDRYESITVQCKSLRDKAAAGEVVSQKSVTALFGELGRLRNMLQQSSGKMSKIQRERFDAIRESYDGEKNLRSAQNDKELRQNGKPVILSGAEGRGPGGIEKVAKAYNDGPVLKVARVPIVPLPKVVPLAPLSPLISQPFDKPRDRNRLVSLPNHRPFDSARPFEPAQGAGRKPWHIVALATFGDAINYGFHASYAPDRWGGYVSLRTNLKSQLYAYDILSDGTTGGEERFEAKGGQRIGEYSAVAGVIRTVTPWLELYAGAGYGSSTLCWNDIHGAWAKVRDYSAAGLLLDGGAVFHLGTISLLGGVSYLTARPESGPFKPVFSIGAGIGF